MNTEMNTEKYLPIGTVVMLKEGKKRVMIYGFCAVPKENKGTVYDYSGCMYPEGLITSSQMLLFNHDQIEKIFYLGYVDDEEKEFKKKLNELMKNVSANKAE